MFGPGTFVVVALDGRAGEMVALERLEGERDGKWKGIVTLEKFEGYGKGMGVAVHGLKIMDWRYWIGFWIGKVV